MRTTPEESASLGEEIARKLSASTGPVALFVPLGGISMIATPGGPFYDAAADEALFSAVRANVGPNVELIELESDINDPTFAEAMVAKLASYVGSAA
jgi:uncharacterized protein (UPF0261 family)